MDIVTQRLYNQHIAQQPLQKPTDVVAWLGAMQAQDYTGAKWSIGLRLPHATDAHIEQAIENKTIVRTWPLRAVAWEAGLCRRRRCALDTGPDGGAHYRQLCSALPRTRIG